MKSYSISSTIIASLLARFCSSFIGSQYNYHGYKLRNAFLGDFSIWSSPESSSSETKPIRLLDLVQEASGNPDIKIPFIEPLGNSFIECKVHFSVKVEGVPFIVATPVDHSAAICFNDKEDISGMTNFLLPEDKKMDEIFSIASSEISKACPDLTLKRTPRTLTISGDLNKYVEKKKQTNENDELEAIMNNFFSDVTEEDEQYFQDTMKRLLGDEYVSKEQMKDYEDYDIDPAILELFNSTTQDFSDEDEVVELMQEILREDNQTVDDLMKPDFIEENVVAERLLSFVIDSELYSLVRMMQPTIIIGRDDPEFDSRKLLLTPQESNLILPKLETVCLQEFGKIGLL